MFFSYLFYCTFWWNVKVVKNNSYPYFASVIWITFLQCINIVFFIDLIGIIYFNKLWIFQIQTRCYGVFLISVLLLINFYLHKKPKSFNEIQKRFNHWSCKKKKLYALLCIAYILASIASISYIAYFIRNRF